MRKRLWVAGGAAVVVLLAVGAFLWSSRSSEDGETGVSTAPAPALASGSGSVAGSVPGPVSPSWWRPRSGLTWQWQLSGTLDRSVDAQVYDVDGQDTSAADVAALKAAGRKVICYVNAGAFEDWRPDAGRFPKALLGKELDGWPGERWLDVRQWAKLEPILAARFDTCRAKGFDAVEPDNVDGYANGSGFPLSAADQLAFNRKLADLAHRRGLAVGLKNDVDQARELEPVFDFAVNEECAEYEECDKLQPFVAAGKPVFHVEYGGRCPESRHEGFSSLRKRPELDAWRETC